MSNKANRFVTGLIITPSGLVSIGRKNKRYIRKLIFDLKNEKLDLKKISYLKGYLSFVLDVDPKFFDNLKIKYGSKLVTSALK